MCRQISNMVQKSIKNFKNNESGSLFDDLTRTSKIRYFRIQYGNFRVNIEQKEVQRQIKRSYSREKTRKLIKDLKNRTVKVSYFV